MLIIELVKLPPIFGTILEGGDLKNEEGISYYTFPYAPGGIYLDSWLQEG
jgi:hypothetical protein